MRTWIPVLLGVLSAGGRAAASDAAAAGAVGVDSNATRYGTSYETVYLVSLEPRAALRWGALELAALLPLSSSATYPTFCCRLALGNATLSAVLRDERGGLSHWLELGASVPSSHWSDAHSSSLAATAALLRDAGHYLPDTTTLRAGLGADVQVQPWLRLGAHGGAHYWLRADGEVDPLIVPLSASASASWAAGWAARASYRAQLRLLDAPAAQERWLSQLSAALVHDWPGSRLELSLSVPLAGSLRELGMFSVGTRYVRSF